MHSLNYYRLKLLMPYLYGETLMTNKLSPTETLEAVLLPDTTDTICQNATTVFVSYQGAFVPKKKSLRSCATQICGRVPLQISPFQCAPRLKQSKKKCIFHVANNECPP
jgi:hypothetical protein